MDDINKTIIAFANCDGGNLYIGIEDNGTVCGVDNIDDCQLRVVSFVRDSIKPDVSMFTNVTVETMDSKQIIRAEVQYGTGYPYYIGSKGLRPEGVFVRRSASTVPVTETSAARPQSPLLSRKSASDFHYTGNLQEMKAASVFQFYLKQAKAFCRKITAEGYFNR